MDRPQCIFFDVCGFKFSVHRSPACMGGVIFFLQEMYGRISWTLARMLIEIITGNQQFSKTFRSPAFFFGENASQK